MDTMAVRAVLKMKSMGFADADGDTIADIIQKVVDMPEHRAVKCLEYTDAHVFEMPDGSAVIVDYSEDQPQIKAGRRK